ncbi:hypothetical protein PTMSG1_05258 [Pyrenophora teres f. maculata]|nr:hypothetical protein PTMSG1_05258 [Pyrenophora teres f. maculata]
MSATLPHPPLDLRKVLLVHLLVFQEAVFALQIDDFDVIGFDYYTYDYPVYIFQSRSVPGPVDMGRFDNDKVYRAVVMKFHCDNFCVVMERFIQNNIRRLLSIATSVTRIVFKATPAFRAIRQPIIHEDMHSCLLVTENNKEMILDGTIDQYGLEWRTHWLLTKEAAMASHMGDLDPRDDDEWEEIRKSLSDPYFYHGYWGGVADRRIEELFETLDWESLRGLSEAEIESSIRAIARNKFVGAYEEAQERAQIRR